MYKIETLKNGSRIVSLNMPYMESITVGIWVGVGGRFEEVRLSGISHFLEHLLFKGTKKRTALQITQMIEGAGGMMNAFTSEEMTCYFAKVLKNRFETAADILSDMFFNAVLKAEDVEKERNIIFEELHMGIDSPSNHVMDLLDGIMWPGHPLGRRLIGSEESIGEIQLKDIINFKKKHYLSSQMVISIAGNLKDIDYLGILENYFSSASEIREFPINKFISNQESPEIAVLEKKTEQTHMALGIRSFPRGDKRRFALRLLNIILGENMSSRLFQTVREKHGLSYDINSLIEYFIDTGALVISAGLDSRRTKDAIDCIVKQLNILKKQKVSGEELKHAQEYAIGRLLLMNEKTNSQMMYAGEQLLCLGKVLPISKIIKEIKQVSENDLQEVARELFVDERTSIALIGPVKDKEKIMSNLDLG